MDRVLTYGLAGVGGIFVVATVVLGIAGRDAGDVAPPEAIPRGLVLGLLFSVPAVIGAIGVRRRDAVLLAAAGVAALAPAWLSVATLPLVIPALLLLVASGSATRPGRARQWLVALAVVGLQAGAIAGLLGTTEPRCWVAYPSGGGYEYRFVPVYEGLEMGGPGQPVAGGCDGGALTERGVALAGVLGVGALTVAFGVPKRRPVVG
jgi:hypothetical protein